MVLAPHAGTESVTSKSSRSQDCFPTLIYWVANHRNRQSLVDWIRVQRCFLQGWKKYDGRLAHHSVDCWLHSIWLISTPMPWSWQSHSVRWLCEDGWRRSLRKPRPKCPSWKRQEWAALASKVHVKPTVGMWCQHCVSSGRRWRFGCRNPIGGIRTYGCSTNTFFGKFPWTNVYIYANGEFQWMYLPISISVSKSINIDTYILDAYKAICGFKKGEM